MTPEQKQALQEHVKAIAKILYEDTSPERLTSLAGIEQAVRNQMQKHVMPEVGVFCRSSYRNHRRIPTTTQKYPGRVTNNEQASY